MIVSGFGLIIRVIRFFGSVFCVIDVCVDFECVFFVCSKCLKCFV